MKTLVSSLAAIAFAMSANAAIITTSSSVALDGYEGGIADSVVYSSMGGPYAAFAASNTLGAANYGSTMALDSEQVTSFKFVG
ncbi:MAG: hypothetical protein EXS17_08400 [Phycisphaerales bacterium]|nr:hypothetical protein [Phycisphaerales bacterium]